MNSYSGLSCWLQELDKLKSSEFKEVKAGKTKDKSEEMTLSLELSYRGCGKVNGPCEAARISSCAFPDLLIPSRLLLLLLPLTKKKKALKLQCVFSFTSSVIPQSCRIPGKQLWFIFKQACKYVPGPKGKECRACFWGDEVDRDEVPRLSRSAMSGEGGREYTG